MVPNHHCYWVSSQLLVKFMSLGLSNPPGHSPYPHVPDRRSPNPTAPAVGRGSRAPKPDVGRSVSSPLVQIPWNPTCPKTSNSGELSNDFNEFSAWFCRFRWPKQSDPALIHQIRLFSARFGGKIIGFDEIFTGSRLDWAGSRRFWPFFCVFRRVSASPKTDATRRKTDPQIPTILTGRLRVENLPTRSIIDRLQVGHKPDPPNPWTPLSVTTQPGLENS